MSEDPIIRIGKQGRKFGGTRYIETDTVGGGSCFWVPETDRKLTNGFFNQNGYYVPQKYGFSELDVHVPKTITDNNGIDWTIDFDPIQYPDFKPDRIKTVIDDLNIDLKDIDIDDLKIILDELGIDIDINDLQIIIDDLGIDLKDIDIDGITQLIDAIPGIDDIDIDDINGIIDQLGIDPDNIGPGDVQDILDDLGIDIPIDDLQDIMDDLGIDPDDIGPDDILGLIPYLEDDPSIPPEPEVPVFPGRPEDYDPDTYDPETFDPEDFYPEQFYPDIYGPEPYDPDKYYPDGYDPDGFDPDLFDPDGLGPDAIPDFGGFDDDPPADDGLPTVPNIGIPDADLDCPFDPETGLPTPMQDGEPIAPDAFPDFPGTLPEGEWDFSFDPPADMQDPDFDPASIPWEMSFPGADGLPEGWTFDPKTGEWSLTELPDEIRIMHVPNKTAYKDGEEIDLDGLVVQAYRNGEIWQDEEGKYYNGYVPAHELIIDPTTANINYELSHLLEILEKNTDRFSSTVENRHFLAKIGENALLFINRNNSTDMNFTALSETLGAIVTFVDKEEQAPIHSLEADKQIDVYGHPLYYSREFHYAHSCTKDISPLLEDYVPLNIEEIEKELFKIQVAWPRPHDNKMLTAEFQIKIDDTDRPAILPSGGTHYSGTWGDDTPSGHWGGTTPSGEYGGSHYSGKF